MQNKTTIIVILLILLMPINSFSMTDPIFEVGLAAGFFVVITILVVIGYVLNEIITNKKITIKNPTTPQRD
jgi:hypothetical protein